MGCYTTHQTFTSNMYAVNGTWLKAYFPTFSQGPVHRKLKRSDPQQYSKTTYCMLPAI